MSLSLEQASDLMGVPVAQLRVWACWGVGPKHQGRWHKPTYDEDEVRRWCAEKGRVVGIDDQDPS